MFEQEAQDWFHGNIDPKLDGDEADGEQEHGHNEFLRDIQTEEENAINEGRGVTRRVVNKALALAGLVGLGWASTDTESSGHKSKEEKSASEQIEDGAQDIVNRVDKEYPNLPENAKAMKIIDYLGAFLFGTGVLAILCKKHINAYHYGALLALTAAKCHYSDEEGRHRLKNGIKSNAKTFAIISGSIVVAEGLNADVEKTFEAEYEKKPDKHDQVALMTMLASVLSPSLTTVSSAGILKKMSAKVANGNKKMMASCVSHISNLSGFLLFGDPPFIAICEKYGFWEGVMWQMKTMWPLALYSLYMSTYKLNLELLKQEGISADEADPIAKQKTIQGFKTNLPVLASILKQSAMNFTRYFRGKRQDGRGLEVKIGEVIEEKLINFATLPFDPKFSHPKEHKSDAVKEQDSIAEIAGTIAADGEAEAESHHPLNEAMSNVLSLDEFRAKKGDAVKDIRSWYNPKRIWDYSTSMPRIKEAAGENLGDVINVFPFQAGCVPFLTPVFKDLANSLEGLQPDLKEMLLFFMVMIFSMFADNYVACKIGLELMPDKPHMALIAAIQGGSMTATGNMSNVTQFSLEEFSLSDSFKTTFSHADNVLVGLAYGKALSLLESSGIFKIAAYGAGGAAVLRALKTLKSKVPSVKQSDQNEEKIDKSRRAFLFLKKDDEEEAA